MSKTPKTHLTPQERDLQAQVHIKGMQKAAPELYAEILDEPMMAFHFKRLCLMAAGKEPTISRQSTK